jgi:hypothetical protein
MNSAIETVTAAHRTLPFGTMVTVVNNSTGLAAALARWSNHVLAVIEDQQPKIVTLRERTA